MIEKRGEKAPETYVYFPDTTNYDDLGMIPIARLFK